MRDSTKAILKQHVLPAIVFVFLVAIHLKGFFDNPEHRNWWEAARAITEITVAVLLSEALMYFIHLQTPLKGIESEMIPKVNSYLDHSLQDTHEDLNLGIQELHERSDDMKRILKMFMDDKEFATLFSTRIIPTIGQILDKSVDRVILPPQGNPAYWSAPLREHRMAREALKEMLEGINKQIEMSIEWGLSVESLTPEPKDPNKENEAVPKYCEFVMKQTSNASVFLGLSLMPPAWWLDESLGLPQILNSQVKRIGLLEASGDFNVGQFARIFVVPEKFVDSFSDFKYRGHSKSDRVANATEWKRKQAEAGTVLTDADNEFLEFYTKDDNPPDEAMQTRILLQDKCVQEVKRIHESANILIGFHVVSPSEYKKAKDFVFLVDGDGFECAISSMGFEYTVLQNNSNTQQELKENLAMRYSGFMEGRLFYYPMGDLPLLKTPGMPKIGERALCWRDHAQNLTWTSSDKEKFMWYFNHMRRKREGK